MCWHQSSTFILKKLYEFDSQLDWNYYQPFKNKKSDTTMLSRLLAAAKLHYKPAGGILIC